MCAAAGCSQAIERGHQMRDVRNVSRSSFTGVQRLNFFKAKILTNCIELS